MSAYFQILINDGKRYLNEHKVDLAIKAFKDALEIAESKEDAYILIGQIFHEHEIYDIAKQCFEKALETNPDNDFARQLLSQITMNLSELRFFGL